MFAATMVRAGFLKVRATRVGEGTTFAQILRLVEKMLRPRKVNVLLAPRPTEALQICEQQDVDLLISDMMMPGRNGWEIAEELLADEATSGIPIVFLTARAEVKDRAKGIDLGGVDYVTKPFNPVELAPLVRDLVHRVESGERDDLRREKFAELRELLDRD